MPFEKNDNRINKSGRPVGATNKLTKDLRTVLKNIMFDEFAKIPSMLETLETKERLELLIKIMPFVLPKVETIKHTTNEPTDFDFC